MLARLHQAVDEACKLPTKLSDGIDYDNVDLDVHSDDECSSDLDFDPVAEGSDDDDDTDWNAAGLDPETLEATSEGEKENSDDDIPERVVEVSVK